METFLPALTYGPMFLYIVAIPFSPSAIQSLVCPPYHFITTVSLQDGLIKAPWPRGSALSPDGKYAALLSGDTLFIISLFDPTGHRFNANVPDCDEVVLSFLHDAAKLSVVKLVNGRVYLDTFDVATGTKEGPRVFDPTVNERSLTKLINFELSLHGAYTLILVDFQPTNLADPELANPELAHLTELADTWLFVYDEYQPLWHKKVSCGCSHFVDDDKIVLQLDDKKVHLFDNLTGESKFVLMEKETSVSGIGVSSTSVVIGDGTSLSVYKDGLSQPAGATMRGFCYAHALFS